MVLHIFWSSVISVLVLCHLCSPFSLPRFLFFIIFPVDELIEKADGFAGVFPGNRTKFYSFNVINVVYMHLDASLVIEASKFIFF